MSARDRLVARWYAWTVWQLWIRAPEDEHGIHVLDPA